MGLASLLTDTPALGFTPGRRRWLGTGALVAVLVSFLALPVWFFLAAGYDQEPPREVRDRWIAATAAFGASVVALPCALAWERGRGGVLAPLGVALALAGLAWAFAGIVTAEPPPGMRGLEYETPFRVGWAWAAVALGAPAGCASLIAILGGTRRFTVTAVAALASTVALLFGAIWEGVGTHPQERAFSLGFVLLLAAAHASVVSAVRMKLGHRMALHGLNALCTGVLASAILTGTAGGEFGASFAAVAWLYAPLAIAIPLTHRLGGVATADTAAWPCPGLRGAGWAARGQRADALASKLAARLTDTPALGLTPRRRRWLGSGALAVMLASSAAFSVFVLQDSGWEAGDAAKQGLRDRRDAAFAAFGAGAVALACALAWERGRGGVLAPLGAALAAAGLALAIAAAAAGGEDGTRLGQAWTAIALGAPAAVASLIATLGGNRRFAVAAVAALASTVALLLVVILIVADGHVLLRARDGLPTRFTAGTALLGAIWEGRGHHPRESVFWLWLTLSLAAAHASVVSAVRMKLGHRAVLYGLNALWIAMLAYGYVAGTTTREGGGALPLFLFLFDVWLPVSAVIAIPLAYRLGGAPAADAGGGAAGAAARFSPRCGAPPKPSGAGARTA